MKIHPEFVKSLARYFFKINTDRFPENVSDAVLTNIGTWVLNFLVHRPNSKEFRFAQLITQPQEIPSLSEESLTYIGQHFRASPKIPSELQLKFGITHSPEPHKTAGQNVIKYFINAPITERVAFSSAGLASLLQDLENPLNIILIDTSKIPPLTQQELVQFHLDSCNYTQAFQSCPHGTLNQMFFVKANLLFHMQEFDATVAEKKQAEALQQMGFFPTTTGKSKFTITGEQIAGLLNLLKQNGVDLDTLNLPMCSISHEVIREPVRAADEQIYEKSQIMQWLHNHNRLTSPNTGLALLDKTLYEDHKTQQQILEHLKKIYALVIAENSYYAKPKLMDCEGLIKLDFLFENKFTMRQQKQNQGEQEVIDAVCIAKNKTEMLSI
jgi:hypothetical protein